MRALVTGAAGFVGRHMSNELDRRGYTVHEVDIVNGYDALSVFRTSHPASTQFDLVVHCAAQAPHRAAIDTQPATHVYNQLLDAAMFDWAIRTKQRRVLYFSSSAGYPVRLQDADLMGRLKESDVDLGDVVQPDASYGWVKLSGERMAASARTCGVPVTVVRPFSGYGEDQGTDWPFGAFLERVSRRDDPFLVWGDGTQVRDWIHIDDVVAGALAVVESDTEEPVNLCTGVGTSMADLIGLMAAGVGYRPALAYQPNRPAGVAYRVGDPAQLHRYFTPAVSIEEGVKRALAAR